MRPIVLALTLIALFAVELASGQNSTPPPFPIRVKVLQTYGNGCPPGAVSATMSPDNSAVSILFDQLSTNLPASSVLVREKKTCSVALNLIFGGQYRIAVVGSDIRGFVSIPSRSQSVISVTHDSALDPGGKYSRKLNFQKSFNGPIEQNIEVFPRITTKPIWSYCGTQILNNPAAQNFRFLTITIDVSSLQQNADNDLIASIDSLDFAAPLTYHLTWIRDTRSCPRF